MTEHQVSLTYFKESGKYYSQGQYQTEVPSLDQVSLEVCRLMDARRLPGLAVGHSDYDVLIEFRGAAHFLRRHTGRKGLSLIGNEKEIVRKLGEAMGFGRIMQLCEQIWREKQPGGEHTVGPCGTFMVPCPHPDGRGQVGCDICCGSGRITKGVLELLRIPEPSITEAVNKPKVHCCPKSPSGYCEYDVRADPMRDDCLHCHDPYERK